MPATAFEGDRFDAERNNLPRLFRALGADEEGYPGFVAANRGIARQIDAQSQSVDKKADQSRDLMPAAVGAGCADNHFLLSGQAAQDHSPRRQ